MRLPHETLPDKIYYFRHGQSVGNALGMSALSLKDTPNHRYELTKKGKVQAMQLAEYIEKNHVLEDVKEMYASSFLRAQQTLEIVLEGNDMPVSYHKDSRLDEWWKGIFYTLNNEEIEKFYPLEKRTQDIMGWHHYKPPQGESGKDVEMRIISFLGSLKETPLISSHGRFGGFFRRVLTDAPLHPNCRYVNPKNCELWLFEKRGDKYSVEPLFRPESSLMDE